MRRFNPEKELNRIQRGNKNKIILFVISLIIVCVMGYSFALYQVRYSKRIIYTKVAPFNNKDIILSVKVEGESSPRKYFPSREDGLSYVGIECEEEDTTSGRWNYETWSLDLNTKGPNKCTVLFKKANLFSEVIVANNLSIFNDDPGQNIRYAGEDPNNYVWFNCDDYNKLSQETAASKCEKWRIIGLFKDITKADDAGTEDLVKIIRDSVGTMAWDSSGYNNWNNASLKPLLENYYTGSELSSAKGIKESTREMIEKVTWNLGGHTTNAATAQTFYTAERGTTVPSGAPQTYDGYIGLMYPSDYGYATTGSNSGTDRDTCLAATLNQYYNNSCYQKDWLYITSTYQWTFTPYSSDSRTVFAVYTSGYVLTDYATSTRAVRPSLYLKSTVQIADGNGSNETPYILVP